MTTLNQAQTSQPHNLNRQSPSSTAQLPGMTVKSSSFGVENCDPQNKNDWSVLNERVSKSNPDSNTELNNPAVLDIECNRENGASGANLEEPISIDCARPNCESQASKLASVSKNVDPIQNSRHVSSTPIDQSISKNSSVTCINLNNLPTLESPVFSGDPSNFRFFISMFETAFGSTIQDPKRKLVLLLKYTSGVPHKLVLGCQNNCLSKNCYQDAVNRLTEQYGQKSKIGLACLSSISNGPPLKIVERDNLIIFSSELDSCANTLTEIGYDKVSVLDINKIASRMPREWNSGWLSFWDQVVHERQEELTLNHLAKYVRRKAREISNVPPVCNNASSPTIHHKPMKSTFATTVDKAKDLVDQKPEKPVCVKCGAQHYLNQCPDFRKLDWKDCMEFVSSRKLCFSCLKPGHRSSECHREYPCKY